MQDYAMRGWCPWLQHSKLHTAASCFPNSAVKLYNSLDEETRGLPASQFMSGLSKSLKARPLYSIKESYEDLESDWTHWSTTNVYTFINFNYVKKSDVIYLAMAGNAWGNCNGKDKAKVLFKKFPIYANNFYILQLPGHLQVRLEAIQNLPPTSQISPQLDSGTERISNVQLLRWLQRLQFKMGQIELQSSAATHFYSLWFAN